MIRKLFILGLVLAVCLELSQGKPTFPAKEMEEYAEALIQEVINQRIEEIASAQKDCNPLNRFNWTQHMHNCKGKCCSPNKDGTGGYKNDKRSQRFCGYCFGS